MGIIYAIVNAVNKKLYVGSTTKGEKRVKQLKLGKMLKGD